MTSASLLGNMSSSESWSPPEQVKQWQLRIVRQLGLFDDEGGENSDLYEFLIWSFAGFLILLIVVMWGCYYWASFRLRQEETRRKSRRAGKHRDSATPATHFVNHDEYSVGSRPKVIEVPSEDDPEQAIVVRAQQFPMFDMVTSDDDGSWTVRTKFTTSAGSVGSMATYINAMRAAAARLGSERVTRRAMAKPTKSRHRVDLDDSMGDNMSYEPESIPDNSYGEADSAVFDQGTIDSGVMPSDQKEGNNNTANSVVSEEMSLYM